MTGFGLNSFLEETIFGLMADQDEEELRLYDESIVTSVIETGPQCEDNDCDDDFSFDGEEYSDWDDIDFGDDDNYNDPLIDDIEDHEIFDAYSNDGYRPYF